MDYLNSANNSFSNISLFIKLCCFIRYGSSWTENKTKKNYTVWNVYEGNIWIEIDGKTYHASAGDSILFYPGDTYRAYTDENGCSFCSCSSYWRPETASISCPKGIWREFTERKICKRNAWHSAMSILTDTMTKILPP